LVRYTPSLFKRRGNNAAKCRDIACNVSTIRKMEEFIDV
jgi:hypothetical protein